MSRQQSSPEVLVNYYEVLGLNNILATDLQIKEAYKKVALECHPDRNIANQVEATKKFQLINTAYNILSDPQKRAIHNSDLLNADTNAKIQIRISERQKKIVDAEKALHEPIKQALQKFLQPLREEKSEEKNDDSVKMKLFEYFDDPIILHNFVTYCAKVLVKQALASSYLGDVNVPEKWAIENFLKEFKNLYEKHLKVSPQDDEVLRKSKLEKIVCFDVFKSSNHFSDSHLFASLKQKIKLKEGEVLLQKFKDYLTEQEILGHSAATELLKHINDSVFSNNILQLHSVDAFDFVKFKELYENHFKKKELKRIETLLILRDPYVIHFSDSKSPLEVWFSFFGLLDNPSYDYTYDLYGRINEEVRSFGLKENSLREFVFGTGSWEAAGFSYFERFFAIYSTCFTTSELGGLTQLCNPIFICDLWKERNHSLKVALTKYQEYCRTTETPYSYENSHFFPIPIAIANFRKIREISWGEDHNKKHLEQTSLFYELIQASIDQLNNMLRKLKNEENRLIQLLALEKSKLWILTNSELHIVNSFTIQQNKMVAKITYDLDVVKGKVQATHEVIEKITKTIKNTFKEFCALRTENVESHITTRDLGPYLHSKLLGHMQDFGNDSRILRSRDWATLWARRICAGFLTIASILGIVAVVSSSYRQWWKQTFWDNNTTGNACGTEFRYKKGIDKINDGFGFKAF